MADSVQNFKTKYPSKNNFEDGFPVQIFGAMFVYVFDRNRFVNDRSRTR